MESSDRFYPPIDPRDAKVIADIDRVLAEYDRQVRQAADHVLASEGIAVIPIEP